jgi:hypothetical protein
MPIHQIEIVTLGFANGNGSPSSMVKLTFFHELIVQSFPFSAWQVDQDHRNGLLLHL